MFSKFVIALNHIIFSFIIANWVYAISMYLKADSPIHSLSLLFGASIGLVLSIALVKVKKTSLTKLKM